jgi:carboxymethylenebutenolidase
MWLRSILFAAAFTLAATAQAQDIRREIFPPPQGRGAIVVVVSGFSGVGPYREFSARLAQAGYYTVLMHGTDLFDMFNPRSEQPAANLKKVLADTQSAPQALAGKAALVGLSLGGAGVLLHGAPLREQVAAVVTFYPAINRLGMDELALAQKVQVPALVLAAEKDEQDNCCKIESMRALAAAAKAAPLELVVYPEAGHGFNVKLPQFVHREADAADALGRTLAFLAKLHPAGGP